MTTVSIINEAGSAGKTTTAVTLAALAAQDGLRVRLIDLDGQGTATHWLARSRTSPNAADVLLQDVPLDDATVDTDVDGLTLVPSGRDLYAATVELSRRIGGEQLLRVRIAEAQPVDLTIIDCPGSIGILNVAALVASDHAVTVTLPGLKEVRGIAPIRDTIAEVAAMYGRSVALAAIVPCAVPPANAGAAYVEAMELLKERYGDLVTPPVRRSVRVADAQVAQEPLPVAYPHEQVTEDYRIVYKDLQSRGVQ